MKPDELETESRTIETRLSHPQAYGVIEILLAFMAEIRHRLWRDLVVKKGTINELKKEYIAEYGLTARQFNSLANEISAKRASLEEIKKERIAKLATSIKVAEQKVSKLQKDLKASSAKLKAIETYKDRIRAWKAAANDLKKPRKKPPMPAAIKGQHREQIKAEISQNKFVIHQKKRRLGILQHKLAVLKQKAAPSLCFGGKAQFKKQFNLEQSSFTSHHEWLEDFRLRRSSQVFFIGSSDETAGNQTVQYDPEAETLRLRLPNAKIFLPYGSHLELAHVSFPRHLWEQFCAALAEPGKDKKKNQKTVSPVAYRLLCRHNKNAGEKAYYLQASFAVPAPEVSTHIGRGAVGVDLNADHIAVTETDRSGNYVDSFIVPFDLDGLSTHQTEAMLGDISALIAAEADKLGKPIVIEHLDFEEKKKALRELPRERRRFLSAFAYAHFHKAVSSRARSRGIGLISINPAYTSLVGAYKYQGLNISSHEKAALAIARRAQGYSEGLKVFQGTLPSQAMMTERLQFEGGTRHGAP